MILADLPDDLPFVFGPYASQVEADRRRRRRVELTDATVEAPGPEVYGPAATAPQHPELETLT